MNKVMVSSEVPKELHELNVGLYGVAKAVKTALADGWQADKDVPVIVMAALQELAPAVEGMSEIPAEVSEDSPGAIFSGGWLVSRLVELFKPSKAA